jgi:methionyl-tRNA synthetase
MAEENKPTEEITFDYFEKVDLRVGKIIEAVAISGSKKLLQIQVDFGTEKRQCIAGRMIAGLESQVMILAAEDAAGIVSVLQPEKDIVEGSKIG